MKNFFLAVLLANLLVAGWYLWVAPKEVSPMRLSVSGAEPELQPAPAAPALLTPARSAPLASPGDVRQASLCLRIGPFADRSVAEATSARLQREGAAVTQSAEEGQVWVGHWVQLENLPGREEANRVVARLSAAGLTDAYVLQNSPPISISLGVFRDRDRAEKVAGEARKLGLRPRTTDRYRSGVQYWLTTRLPDGRNLAWEQLSRESGQILRSETASCPASEVSERTGN